MALIRQFEAAFAPFHGSGKAPFSCPKSSLSSRVSGRAAQFTRTKGPRRRREFLVQGFGHQLLARPGLAGDEHGGVAAGHTPDELIEGLHGAAGAHDPLARIPIGERILEVTNFF